MILVLTPESPTATVADSSRKLAGSVEVCFRTADSNDKVLEWIATESIERIIVPYPMDSINPFALSRSLRRNNGPKLILAGEFSANSRFWAERNGCLTAPSIEAALETA